MSTSSTTVSGSIEITPDSPLENAIVDTSQTFDIIHRGGVMRNVGFDGQATVDSSFSVQIPPDVEGTISHTYLGDGDGRNASIGSASAAIFVSAKHAGHLRVNELHVAGWSDNGCYASAPGNGSDWGGKIPGRGGTVQVTNSYGGNCGNSVFRLGTNGSVCRNCVVDDTAVGGGSDRATWQYVERSKWQDIRVRTGGHRMTVSSDAWGDKKGATAELENCFYTDGTLVEATGARLVGSWTQDTAATTSMASATTSDDSGDTSEDTDQIVYQTVYDEDEDTFRTMAVDLRPPSGVPMTAQEGADGTSSADGASVPAGSPAPPGSTGGGTTGSTSPANCEFVVGAPLGSGGL